MQGNPESLTIGAFAKAAGVNLETIRFYQRKGLLPEPQRPPGGIRRYGQADVARLRFVKAAQGLGFSLEEVAELLRLDDGEHCAQASRLAEHKLLDVRAKLADLARIEGALSRLVHACHAGEEKVSCPLIASLQGATDLALATPTTQGPGRSPAPACQAPRARR
jgi:MerR family mercuric resistance operon transcriptional regulator